MMGGMVMLQVDIGKLSELTQQCHEDSVTRLKSAAHQLVQDVLAYVQSTSVTITCRFAVN